MPRKAEFFVPTEVIVEFTEEMLNRKLSNSITALSEDYDLIIEVEYDKEQTEDVDELESVLERLIENMEEEEEEEDK